MLPCLPSRICATARRPWISSTTLPANLIYLPITHNQHKQEAGVTPLSLSGPEDRWVDRLARGCRPPCAGVTGLLERYCSHMLLQGRPTDHRGSAASGSNSSQDAGLLHRATREPPVGPASQEPPLRRSEPSPGEGRGVRPEGGCKHPETAWEPLHGFAQAGMKGRVFGVPSTLHAIGATEGERDSSCSTAAPRYTS